MNNYSSDNILDFNLDFDYDSMVNNIITYLDKPIELVKNIFKKDSEVDQFLDNCLQLDSLMNITLTEIFPKLNIFFYDNDNYKKDIFYVFNDIEAMLDYIFKKLSNIIHKLIQLNLVDSNLVRSFNFDEMIKLIELSTDILKKFLQILDNKFDKINDKINLKEYEKNYKIFYEDLEKISADFYTNIYEENEVMPIVKKIANMEF